MVSQDRGVEETGKKNPHVPVGQFDSRHPCPAEWERGPPPHSIHIIGACSQIFIGIGSTAASVHSDDARKRTLRNADARFDSVVEHL